jgi:hypothetical protein
VPAPQGNPLGSGRWLQAGDGDDLGRMWVQYGPQLAPMLVLSDLDDPSRVQFQQTGSGTEAAPQFQSWMGHARSGSPDLALSGGRVGIGTLTPERVLHVEGEEVHSGGSGAGYSFGNRGSGFVGAPGAGERWILYADGGVARLWSGTDKLAVDAAGHVGVGTTAPTERLDVRGNVRLGDALPYFAVGAPENQRMVSGIVASSGNAATGSWLSLHINGTGLYQVMFTVPFLATPVVTATLVDPPADDNLICLRAVSQFGFTVVIRDLDPVASDSSSAQDSAFNFIALGPRP